MLLQSAGQNGISSLGHHVDYHQSGVTSAASAAVVAADAAASAVSETGAILRPIRTAFTHSLAHSLSQLVSQSVSLGVKNEDEDARGRCTVVVLTNFTYHLSSMRIKEKVFSTLCLLKNLQPLTYTVNM